MKKFLPLLLAILAAAPVAAVTPPHRVVLFLLDRVELADLLAPDLPNLARIMRAGAVGLMNARTGGALASEHAYLTIGAGNRGVGWPEAEAAYAAEAPLENGTAAQILRRNTGVSARPGNLVVPGVAGLASLNASLDRTVVPGALGGALRRAGLVACALGNADPPDVPGRYVAALVMDPDGLVETGAVGPELLRPDRTRPFGMRTDGDALLDAFDRLAPRAALVALDYGDTTRLEAYAPYLTPARQAALRHEILREADAFLGRLLKRLDPRRTLLLVLSPSPAAASQEKGSSLTPIVAHGPGFGPGWLTSGTTKRPGLVANIDVAPTVLEFLGVPPPPGMSGRPMRRDAVRRGPAELLRREGSIALMNLWQQPVMRFYTVVLDVILVLTAVFLLWPELPGARAVQAALLLAAGFPLAMLLAPLYQTPGYIGWLAVLAAAIAGLSLAFLRRRHLPLLLLFAGTVLAISLDQLLGGPLAQYALLSYSPVAGSRFYGLGNEYMGVLIGAGIMAAGLTLAGGRDRVRLPVIAALFVLLIVIMGAPNLGTNVGGTLAAVAGFGVAWFFFAERRLSARTALVIGGTALAVLGVLAVLDALRAPGAQSHLGRLVVQVGRGGFTPFVEVVQRKLAMNLKLIRFSGWSRVAVFALAAMAATAVFPAGRGKVLAARDPYVAKAIWASLAGAIAALVFNDSGVVAAATLLIYPATAWLYLLLEEKHAGAPGAR